MLFVYFEGISPPIPPMRLPATGGVGAVDALLTSADGLLPPDSYYCLYDGKPVTRSEPAALAEGVLRIRPRLVGGKGGFGSMLRAIGAQIEKTTNREACRDLSGRRLRDINEEQRLKNWINKKAEREREVAERKKRKLDKLRAEPKHNFSDQKYEEERSKLTSDVSSAIERGFQAAACNPGSTVSTSSSQPKKGFMFEDEEVSSGSSSDSSDEANSSLKQGLKRVADSSDSEDDAKRQCLSASSESSSDESTSQSSHSDSDNECVTEQVS